LGIIHFHNKPFEKNLEAAREKMKLRVDINDKEKIKNYNGPGAHLKKILLQTKEDYYNSYQLNLSKYIREPNFRIKLKEYEISIPF
jgi:hypothetical protein